MPTNASGPDGIAWVAALLIAAIALVWAAELSLVANLSGSDAAGNGLAQAFAAMAILLLWGLLAALLIDVGVRGGLSSTSILASVVLLPASGYAALLVADLLARPYEPPFYWPILVPALAPLIVVAFSVWALVPSLRAILPAPAATGVAWGAVLALSLSVGAMIHIRNAADQREADALAKWAVDFAALPRDAPLWNWTPFLGQADESREDSVLNGVRDLPRRQSEAEIMLDRGDFPLLYLGRFDLDPTPSLCETARRMLARRVQPLIPKTPNSRPHAQVAREVAGAATAMEWLVGYGCSCDAESNAWEAMANAYRDPNFDVVRLAELRDPKNLGRILREYPPKFSMLTPKAHLKAWLSFAGDKTLREQALAGARQLDHRTADAVDMFSDPDAGESAWSLLRDLPELDLEPTPALCSAAGAVIDRELASTYRPPADDPRPYLELQDRLGAGEPLTALTWLAQHGCDADASLSRAEALVGAYKETPGRAEMLATLTRLRRKK
jgi:hypothetical protein